MIKENIIKRNRWANKVKTLKNKDGFTLVEMLIVLVVVALLMAIIIPNVAGQRDRIEDQATENIAEIIENQIHTYELVNGDGASITLSLLADENYITDRQLEEAGSLLGLDSEDIISVPIVPVTGD